MRGLSAALVSGAVLTVLGGVLTCFWPAIFRKLVAMELCLSASSTSFQEWREPSMPLVMDFYFHNWTNPEHLKQQKPAFTQMGPYRFLETRLKTNITWNANGTVSFQQIKRWHFDPKASNGSLRDMVTSLNGIALTAAFAVRYQGYLSQRSVSMALAATRQRVHVTRTVEEFLFKGYMDDLLSIVNSLPEMARPVNSPFDRFGWFYMRNNTPLPGGSMFNMGTGEDDIGDLGQIKRWNYKGRTNSYQGQCGQVEGSAEGELFPPDIQRHEPLRIFSTDICRSVLLDFAGDEETMGLQGYLYEAGQNIVDNGTSNPDNSCFCSGECPPSGVINSTGCRYGAPVFVSYPHFYRGDPKLLEQVHGLRPDPDKHKFFLIMEPILGVLLEVSARIQINLLLQPSEYVTLYKRAPQIYFPILWADQRYQLSDQLALRLRLAVMLPLAGSLLAVTLLAVGVVTLLAAAYRHALRPPTTPRRRLSLFDRIPTGLSLEESEYCVFQKQ